MRIYDDGKSSINIFITWVIKDHDEFIVKFEYNKIKLFEVKVTNISFINEYENERARLKELKKIKSDKKNEDDYLEIEYFIKSIKIKEKRLEIE